MSDQGKEPYVVDEPSAVAYLVSRYPALSNAFIDREIQGLRGLGARVHTFSVRPPNRSDLLTSSMRREADATCVLLARRRLLVAAASRLMVRRPLALVRLVLLALSVGPPDSRGRLWQLFYLVEAVRLHEVLVSRGLRHVHVHFANNGADIARLAVALGRLVEGPDAGWRWTMTMHGPTELEEVTHFDLVRKVEDAHAVACISDFTRSQLMRMTPPDLWSKLEVVRMSVDTERFRPRAAPSGPEGRVLYVGRLVAEKGGPVLLRSIRAVVEAGRQVELRMVGTGPLEPVLRDQIEQLGLVDHVQLVGAVGQEKLPDLYAWADVFCLPSFQEGLPVVLMEAMACGLPVVTTRIAGIPEMVDDSNGRVVTAGREDALAAALDELLDDSDLRADLGHNGRQRIMEQYDADLAAANQLRFLQG